MADTVKVTKEVLEGILVVRDSGALNMFDYQGVLRLAESLGYTETADWMLAHKGQYATGIFVGFEAIDQTIMN
jgi:hypothetical protein